MSLHSSLLVTCVCLHVQQLQQLQRVTPTILSQPVGQQLGASFSHSSIPVLQQLLDDFCTLLDAAGKKQWKHYTAQLLIQQCDDVLPAAGAATALLKQAPAEAEGRVQHSFASAAHLCST
jgi:hypothetical protein